MDHHTSVTQAFSARCEPPPLHPRSIPIFGPGANDGEAPQATGADYYVSNVDHQLQRQHGLHQVHHGAYETPEEYRSQSYAYYASCGPPPYYMETESVGPTTVGVSGNLHAAGLELPMPVDINMARYVQRPASSSSPVYAHQVIAAAPCASVGLPLAPERWQGQASFNVPPMLHRSRDAFGVEQRHPGISYNTINEERASFDWLPVVPSATSVNSSAFGAHFHSENGNAQVKDPEEAVAEQDNEADTARIMVRSGRLSRTKAKKDFNVGDEPIPKFQCFLCSKQYCRRSTLKTHLRHHSGERPYFCSICGKSFAQAANLTAHKRIHTGEKPFACPICCRPFSQSSSLVTHKRTHTGEKPYQCPRCDKAFTDSSTLTKHVRTHTGVKPYSCAICLLSFSQSGNLNRHMKTHLKQPQDEENGRDANDSMRYQVNPPAFQQNARMI